MDNDDRIAAMFVERFGPFEMSQNVQTRSVVIRWPDGDFAILTREELMGGRGDYYTNLMRLMLAAFTKKFATKIPLSKLGDGTTDNQKRMIEINSELDILRGVVPTPKGYHVDINRAKELMTELKKLIEMEKK